MSTTSEFIVADTLRDDSNIVDFNGHDDPELAVNWPASRKWLNVLVLAMITFIAYVQIVNLFLNM